MSNFKAKAPLDRILKIVKRLYALERLKTSYLALEYQVSEKTISRDFQKISFDIPIRNDKGVYSLDTQQLSNHNNVQFELLSAFASNAELLLDCFDKDKMSQDKIAFAIEYNRLPKRLAESIMHCIDQGCKAKFTYQKVEGTTYRVVSPIKLYTSNGRWYLLAKDDKDAIVKTFYFGKISSFVVLDDTPSDLTQEDIKLANEKESPWSNTNGQAFSVRVYVKPEVAEYFSDGKLHPSQDIVDEHYDGGLEIHYMITHKMEILPKIKSYIPHIYVLEPKWLWEELMRSLEYYRDENRRIMGLDI